jgi:hypothetical protein
MSRAPKFDVACKYTLLSDYSHLLADSESQVAILQNKGVSALAISAETLAAAALTGHDIWAEAKTECRVKFCLLFSPEMYLSKEKS